MNLKSLLTLSLVLTLISARAAGATAGWTLIGWNNLGMHCMDADYSVFSLLPPYNTIYAQLIDQHGRLVRDAADITVTYQAVADPDGSINATSAGKTNFWANVQRLFGVALAVDVGLAGSRMPGAGNAPQPMAFDAAASRFMAKGIPITPYDDAGHKNTYPMMRLVARDGSNAVLATTDIVLPVSDEMDCTSCHASGSSAAAQPSDGWVNDPDPQRDMRLNILRLHDDREGFRSAFHDALATAGYNPAGLFATAATDATPVLCARCHRSEALQDSGIAGIEPLTLAVHRRMAHVVDPGTGLPLDSIGDRTACYRCHPGAATRCLRGVMGSAVFEDGTLAMQCQSCHGTIAEVGSGGRTGWLNEPACQSCHTGTATNNNGKIRYVTVFDQQGGQRQAVDQTFATNPNTPSAGLSLYQLSTGHGGVACEGCHGSTHAEFPSADRNDNIQSIDLQGHAGLLMECSACHATVPSTISGGPHGMHPVGQAWVSAHSDLTQGSTAQCQACHGTDYRGTVLSRAHAERTLGTEELGTKHLWSGFQVGCYTCHLGPHNGDANPNQPAVVGGASSTVTAGTPAVIALNATDPNHDALTLRVVSQPQHGTAGLNGTQATYIPDPGFVGSDSFTVAAWDGSTDSNLATVTVTVSAGCPGDCNTDNHVTIAELMRGVNIALGALSVNDCRPFDTDQSNQVTVDELAQAVNAALTDCGALPTPPTATATPSPTPTPTSLPTVVVTATPTTNPDATLANIQASIFTARCALAPCHDAASAANNLVLETGTSFGQLVGVLSANFSAHQAGLLRVNPGNPDSSFLVIKLLSPPPLQGARMPSGGVALPAAQIQLIRDWISQGAQQ